MKQDGGPDDYLHSGPREVHVKLSHALAAGWWSSLSLMALDSSSP